MHAVVVKSQYPAIQTPAQQGHVIRSYRVGIACAGLWSPILTVHGDCGHLDLISMIVFDSEEAASGAAQMIQGPEAMRPETVTLESVEVREVVGSA